MTAFLLTDDEEKVVEVVRNGSDEHGYADEYDEDSYSCRVIEIERHPDYEFGSPFCNALNRYAMRAARRVAEREGLCLEQTHQMYV